MCRYYEKILSFCGCMMFIGLSLATDSTTQLSSDYRLKGSYIYYKKTLLRNADPATFELLKFRDKRKRKWKHDFEHYNSPTDHEYSIYAKDKGTIYYQGKPLSLIDAITFEWVGSGCSKDKNHVYYDGVLLPQADPLSFMFIDRDSLGSISYARAYARDRKHLYYYGKIVEGASISNFGVKGLKYGYLLDEQHIIYKGRVLTMPDPDTFEVLAYKYRRDAYYTKDKNHVYLGNEIIEEADPKTFDITEDEKNAGYATDKNHLFYEGKPIVLVDPKTFSVIKYGYGKDDNHVFYKESIIEHADPRTFTPTYNWYATDKNYLFTQVNWLRKPILILLKL